MRWCRRRRRRRRSRRGRQRARRRGHHDGSSREDTVREQLGSLYRPCRSARLAAALLIRRGDEPERLTLDEFEGRVAAGDVATATIKDRDHAVEGELANGAEYRVSFPAEY